LVTVSKVEEFGFCICFATLCPAIPTKNVLHID
jgi:hypothetical protein